MQIVLKGQFNKTAKVERQFLCPVVKTILILITSLIQTQTKTIHQERIRGFTKEYSTMKVLKRFSGMIDRM